MLNAMGALAAVLINDCLHYFNYTAAKFNHDVIQLPFWAVAGSLVANPVHSSVSDLSRVNQSRLA
jgi:hypothetical protein